MAEAELAEAGLLAARQHGGAAVAAATRLGMKYQLMYALVASVRVAAAAGDLGRAHDDAYQALITGLGIGALLMPAKSARSRNSLTASSRASRSSPSRAVASARVTELPARGGVGLELGLRCLRSSSRRCR